MYASGIHVMRNPFDNIATMTLKKANERTKKPRNSQGNNNVSCPRHPN